MGSDLEEAVTWRRRGPTGSRKQYAKMLPVSRLCRWEGAIVDLGTGVSVTCKYPNQRVLGYLFEFICFLAHMSPRNIDSTLPLVERD